MNKRIFIISTVLLVLILKSLSIAQTLNSDRYIIAHNKVVNCEIFKLPYKYGKASTKDYEKIKQIIYRNGYIIWEGFFTTGKSRKYDYDYNSKLERITVEYKDEWSYKHKEVHEYELDERGNPVKELVYSKDGRFDYKIEYSYDDNKNIIGSTVIEKDGSVSKEEKFTFKYDSLNYVIKKESYSYDDYTKKWNLNNYIDYMYYEGGYINETKTYTNNQEKFKRVKYYYEKNGLLIIKTFFNLEEEPEYDEIYLYEYE